MSRHILERCSKKHLIIHMDINKTIIQVDLAGGRTMEDVLNSNAAANVYGFIDKTGKWKPLYGPNSKAKQNPESAAVEVISYDEYVDKIHCEPIGMQDLPIAERDVMWKKISGARREAVRNFTFSGEVGENYAYLVDQQKKCLLSGPGPTYHVIIPSFFHFVNTLSELQWHFTLIFRTFGSDLAPVLKEWNQFVCGEHICKPKGPVLQHLRDNFVEPVTGCIYRDHDDLFLCYGPCVSASVQSQELEKVEKESLDAITEVLKNLPNCTSVKQTSYMQLDEDMLSFYATSNNVGGLVDYYPFWAQGAERRSCGKVFPVAVDGPRADSHYYIFFDDNIFLGDEKSIVDVRDMKSATSMLGVEKERPYCVPVNAFEAIVNMDYFVDRLCERIQLQQHNKN